MRPLVGTHAEIAEAHDFVIRIEPCFARRRTARNFGDDDAAILCLGFRAEPGTLAGRRLA